MELSAWEGQGPANGRPIQLGFLAVSRNPFALDIAICKTLGIAAYQVPYLTVEDGLKKNQPEVEGDPIRVKSFEIPTGAHLTNRYSRVAD